MLLMNGFDNTLLHIIIYYYTRNSQDVIFTEVQRLKIICTFEFKLYNNVLIFRTFYNNISYVLQIVNKQ